MHWRAAGESQTDGDKVEFESISHKANDYDIDPYLLPEESDAERDARISRSVRHWTILLQAQRETKMAEKTLLLTRKHNLEKAQAKVLRRTGSLGSDRLSHQIEIETDQDWETVTFSRDTPAPRLVSVETNPGPYTVTGGVLSGTIQLTTGVGSYVTPTSGSDYYVYEINRSTFPSSWNNVDHQWTIQSPAPTNATFSFVTNTQLLPINYQSAVNWIVGAGGTFPVGASFIPGLNGQQPSGATSLITSEMVTEPGNETYMYIGLSGAGQTGQVLRLNYFPYYDPVSSVAMEVAVSSFAAPLALSSVPTINTNVSGAVSASVGGGVDITNVVPVCGSNNVLLPGVYVRPTAAASWNINGNVGTSVPSSLSISNFPATQNVALTAVPNLDARARVTIDSMPNPTVTVKGNGASGAVIVDSVPGSFVTVGTGLSALAVGGIVAVTSSAATSGVTVVGSVASTVTLPTNTSLNPIFTSAHVSNTVDEDAIPIRTVGTVTTHVDNQFQLPSYLGSIDVGSVRNIVHTTTDLELPAFPNNLTVVVDGIVATTASVTLPKYLGSLDVGTVRNTVHTDTASGGIPDPLNVNVLSVATDRPVWISEYQPVAPPLVGIEPNPGPPPYQTDQLQSDLATSPTQFPNISVLSLPANFSVTVNDGTTAIVFHVRYQTTIELTPHDWCDRFAKWYAAKKTVVMPDYLNVQQGGSMAVISGQVTRTRLVYGATTAATTVTFTTDVWGLGGVSFIVPIGAAGYTAWNEGAAAFVQPTTLGDVNLVLTLDPGYSEATSNGYGFAPTGTSPCTSQVMYTNSTADAVRFNFDGLVVGEATFPAGWAGQVTSSFRLTPPFSYSFPVHSWTYEDTEPVLVQSVNTAVNFGGPTSFDVSVPAGYSVIVALSSTWNTVAVSSLVTLGGAPANGTSGAGIHAIQMFISGRSTSLSDGEQDPMPVGIVSWPEQEAPIWVSNYDPGAAAIVPSIAGFAAAMQAARNRLMHALNGNIKSWFKLRQPNGNVSSVVHGMKVGLDHPNSLINSFTANMFLSLVDDELENEMEMLSTFGSEGDVLQDLRTQASKLVVPDVPVDELYVLGEEWEHFDIKVKEPKSHLPGVVAGDDAEGRNFKVKKAAAKVRNKSVNPVVRRLLRKLTCSGNKTRPDWSSIIGWLYEKQPKNKDILSGIYKGLRKLYPDWVADLENAVGPHEGTCGQMDVLQDAGAFAAILAALWEEKVEAFDGWYFFCRGFATDQLDGFGDSNGYEEALKAAWNKLKHSENGNICDGYSAAKAASHNAEMHSLNGNMAANPFVTTGRAIPSNFNQETFENSEELMTTVLPSKPTDKHLDVRGQVMAQFGSFGALSTDRRLQTAGTFFCQRMIQVNDTGGQTGSGYSVPETSCLWPRTAVGLTTPPITAGAFVIGLGYTIDSIGTTDFTLIGAPANVVGVHFFATGVGLGTGIATVFSTVLQTDQPVLFGQREDGCGYNLQPTSYAASLSTILDDQTKASYRASSVVPQSGFLANDMLELTRQAQSIGQFCPEEIALKMAAYQEQFSPFRIGGTYVSDAMLTNFQTPIVSVQIAPSFQRDRSGYPFVEQYGYNGFNGTLSNPLPIIPVCGMDCKVTFFTTAQLAYAWVNSTYTATSGKGIVVFMPQTIMTAFGTQPSQILRATALALAMLYAPYPLIPAGFQAYDANGAAIYYTHIAECLRMTGVNSIAVVVPASATARSSPPGTPADAQASGLFRMQTGGSYVLAGGQPYVGGNPVPYAPVNLAPGDNIIYGSAAQDQVTATEYSLTGLLATFHNSYNPYALADVINMRNTLAKVVPFIECMSYMMNLLRSRTWVFNALRQGTAIPSSVTIGKPVYYDNCYVPMAAQAVYVPDTLPLWTNAMPSFNYNRSVPEAISFMLLGLSEPSNDGDPKWKSRRLGSIAEPLDHAFPYYMMLGAPLVTRMAAAQQLVNITLGVAASIWWDVVQAGLSYVDPGTASHVRNMDGRFLQSGSLNGGNSPIQNALRACFAWSSDGCKLGQDLVGRNIFARRYITYGPTAADTFANDGYISGVLNNGDFVNVTRRFCKVLAPLPPYAVLTRNTYLRFKDNKIQTWENNPIVKSVNAGVYGPLVPLQILTASVVPQMAGTRCYVDDTFMANFNIWAQYVIWNNGSTPGIINAYDGASGAVIVSVPTPILQGGGNAQIGGVAAQVVNAFSLWPRKTATSFIVYGSTTTTPGWTRTGSQLLNDYSVQIPLALPTQIYTPIAVQPTQVFGLGGMFSDPFDMVGKFGEGVPDIENAALETNKEEAAVASVGTEAVTGLNQLLNVETGGAAAAVGVGGDMSVSATAPAPTAEGVARS